MTNPTPSNESRIDLVARLRNMADVTALPTIAEAADALEALDNAMSSEHSDQLEHNLCSAKDALRESEAASEIDWRHLVQARAERDALAHVVEQFRGWYAIQTSYHPMLVDIFATAPVVSLARHDAEVWDERNRAASDDFDEMAAPHDKTCGNHPMNGISDHGCSC